MRLLFLFIMICNTCFSQGISEEYKTFAKKADSLFQAGNYKDATNYYSLAFSANNGKATLPDRYNAACSWAMINYADSAFFHLFRLANKAKYTNTDQLNTDNKLLTLRGKKWDSLLVIVNRNNKRAEEFKPVKRILDSIQDEDQKYRVLLDSTEQKFGKGSKEMTQLWKKIMLADHSNVKVVTEIIDKYGWLGAGEIGGRANSTLFLVIQHSNQELQEKYLPIMRQAVRNGNAQAHSLALLEDRVALGQGKKQIYGSQVNRDQKTNVYYVLPLEDPDNVDKRRAEVGLQPLADYVSHWKIKWDVEQYKKDLKEKEKEKGK